MRKLAAFPAAILALTIGCSEGQTPLDPVERPVFDDVGVSPSSTLDAVAKLMTLNVGGSDGTTTLYITPRNGDGKNGCNLTGSTTLVVSVSSSNTAAATVSPSSITIGACGDTPALTVTPVAEGEATVSLAQTSNNTGATFDLTPATFTVRVVGPSNTAPTLSITGVAGGASYAKGSVPAAVCEVIDAEDGNSSFPATLSAITGPYASDGIGAQTASCSYTDGGGLTDIDEATYAIVDPSAPGIDYVLAPASPDGDNGWYRSDVTLTWLVTEDESPYSLDETGCVNQSILSDQDEETYSCSATSAGGSAAEVSVSIKRDATLPTASALPSPAPNANGWNNTDVTVDFSGADATSGIASCSDDVVLSGEGTDLSASGTCTDYAGNVSAAATVTGIKIDRTAPADIAFNGGPSDGASYPWGGVPGAPTCTATDALSGIDSCTVSGYSAAVGIHVLTATALDNAGNVSTASRTYTVDPWDLRGFHRPVAVGSTYDLAPEEGVLWNTVKGGSTVPLKFNIYRGTEESTSTADVESFTTSKVVCGSVPTVGDDPVDMVTTGNTSLRYDAVERQFVQNWKTPSVSTTTCYRVTLKTRDQSLLVSFFKLNR